MFRWITYFVWLCCFAVFVMLIPIAFGQIIIWESPQPTNVAEWQRADIESDRELAEQVALLREEVETSGLSLAITEVVAALDHQTAVWEQLRLEIAGIAASLILIVGWLTRKKSTGLAEGETVNINTANRQRLDLLPGIGPSTAKAIIFYRLNNADTGGFNPKEDILKVSGIGPSTYDGLKHLIVVS